MDALARAYAEQGKQALQHMALAEYYALTGALPASLEQLRIARSSVDATFYDQAVIDARERELLQGEMARLNADAESRAWFEAELAKPVEPAEVAAAVTSPEMAAEVYLASLLVVDETTTMERAYLDELARRLRLDPALKADLEARAAQV